MKSVFICVIFLSPQQRVESRLLEVIVRGERLPKATLTHHDESGIISESITTFISEVPSKSPSFVTSVLHPASRAVAK